MMSDMVSQVGDCVLLGMIVGGGFCWVGYVVFVYYYVEFSQLFVVKLVLLNNCLVMLIFNVDSKYLDVMMKFGILFVSEVNVKVNLCVENLVMDV